MNPTCRAQCRIGTDFADRNLDGLTVALPLTVCQLETKTSQKCMNVSYRFTIAIPVYNVAGIMKGHKQNCETYRFPADFHVQCLPGAHVVMSAY